MRAIKSILYILIVTSIISACMSVNDDDIYVSSDINDYQIEIKSTDYPNIETCVTEKDINDYLNYKRLAYADKQLEYSVKSVDPITHDGNKILAYEIISNQGWELISGDKRSDLLIAYSKNPSTSLGKQPEAAKIWINQYLNFVETLLDYPDFRGSSVYEEEQIKTVISENDLHEYIIHSHNIIILFSISKNNYYALCEKNNKAKIWIADYHSNIQKYDLMAKTLDITKFYEQTESKDIKSSILILLKSVS